jgi:tetratricopeptide (TPR) repeat protein
MKRSAELVAILFLSVLPLGLLEVGLRLGDFGEPADLFLPAPGDSEYLSLNSKFVDVYFPPGLSRRLKPNYIHRQKSEKTYRIFVLGASAAVGFPDHTAGFSRKLGVMLRHGFPELEIEVANLATAAINSHVVFDIARRSAAFDPDLFLIYLGNNEVIGPFGPTAELTLPLDNVHLIRAISSVRRLRVSQWVSGLLSEPSPPKEWRGMRAFIDHPFSHSDPRLDSVYANFRRNLEDIRRIALASGARIVFSSVISNIGDFAPFASEHRSGITRAELTQWDRHFRQGSTKLLHGDFQGSIIDLRNALELDDEYSELHFKLGKAYLSTGEDELAREHLTRARDLDVLRFRADSKINSIIKDVATAHGDETGRVYYVDPTSLAPDGIPGFDLFLEHVHLNSRGNDLLARMLFEAVEDIITADTGSAPGAMELTSEDISNAVFDVPPLRADHLRSMKRMVSRHPFRLRYRNDLLLWRIQKRIDQIESAPFTMADSVMSMLRSDPDDLSSHRKAFKYLKQQLQESVAADDAPRTRELLDWMEELLEIRGQNRDVNQYRARWSREFRRLLQAAR